MLDCNPNSISDTVVQKVTAGESAVEYPRTSNLVLWLFCGYIVAWYLQIGERYHLLGAVRFEFIYAVILGLIAVFHARLSSWRCPLTLPLGLYMGLLIVMVLVSRDLETSFRVFSDRVIKFSFLAIFIVAFVRSPRHLKFFMVAFLLACFKMGEEGLVGTLTGGMIWQNEGVMRLHGVTSLYTHPNSYAGMAIGTLPFVVYLWPLVNRYIKAALLIEAMFALNIVIRSGSRTAYVGLVVALLFLLFRSKAKLKYALFGIVFIIVGFVVVPGEYVERFTSIYTMEDKEGASLEKRSEILSDAIKIFVSNPLGVGVSAFPAVRTEVFGRSQDTHNLYLEIATNLGIQGCVIFALLLFKIFEMLRSIGKSCERQIKNLGERRSEEGIQANVLRKIESHIGDLEFIRNGSKAVIMFLVVRLALGLFGMDLYEIYWWFAIGLTIAMYNMIAVAGLKTRGLCSQS